MNHNCIETVLHRFSLGGVHKKEAANMLFEYLYFHLNDFGFYDSDEDVRSDFLVWIQPYLETIIERYNPDRALFTTYLRMSLQYHFRIFYKKQYQKASYTAVADAEEHYNAILTESSQYAAEPSCEYSVSAETIKMLQPAGGWRDKKNALYKRKLLLLACKSCFFIDDALMQHIADTAGIPLARVQQFVEESKKIAQEKEEHYTKLKQKRDYYYSRYKSAAIQLDAMMYMHPSVVARLEKQKAYNYERWQAFLKKIREYRRCPSNRALAKQFGLSRATIDSNLAVLIKAWYGEI
ncbi:MAG: hypothetical protein ACTTH8_03840 [Treponema sp.]